GGGGGGRSYSC
ncbi:chlamydia polymorphic membrane middle domain protein, partial [Chlamydia psittaci 08DC60]